MSVPIPAELLRLRPSPVRPLRLVAATILGTIAGAALALAAAGLVPPTYRAAADIEFVQAPGTVPLSDAARDARIDGFVAAARSLPVAAAALAAINATAPDDAAALDLADRVRAERVGATALLRIDVRSDAPGDTARLAAAVGDALVRRSLADRIAAIGPRDEALERALTAARDRAERADRALTAWRLRVDPFGSPASDVELAAFRSSTTVARGEAAAATARAAAAARQVIVSASSIGQNGTSSLAELRGQRAEVARRAAVLGQRFDRDYPLRAAATAELAALDRAIAAELVGLSRSARADAAAANARAAAFGEGLAGAQQRRARGLAGEAELVRLEREADAAREGFRLLNQALTVRATERSLARPELRLAVPPAVPRDPVSPDPLLAALFGGLALGLLALCASLWSERHRLAAMRFEP